MECASYEDVADAIRGMKVRGAPAIGVTAAYGMALGATATRAPILEAFCPYMRQVAGKLGSTRPTAVNLFWALEKMLAIALQATRGGHSAHAGRG